jgi:uncharacterized membrane protein
VGIVKQIDWQSVLHVNKTNTRWLMKFFIGVAFSSALFFIYFAWTISIIKLDVMVLSILSGVIIGAVPSMLYYFNDGEV